MVRNEALAITAVAALGGGLAALPNAAEAHTMHQNGAMEQNYSPQPMSFDQFRDAQSPKAHEASTTWTHLGGDPLIPGGIHSRHGFVRFITSRQGRHALAMDGINTKGINALVKAAHDGKERDCTMHYGQRFDAMTYGINGTSIDRNVTFRDPNYRGRGAAAYCLDATVENKNGTKTTYHTLTPKKCGNVALENATHTTVTRPHPKKKAPVYVEKDAVTENGDLMDTPTGTFEFEASCKNGKNTIDRKVMYNHNPQYLITCNVGSVAIVKELAPHSNEQWKLVSPDSATQQFIVRSNKNRQYINKVTYKDQEVGTPPPPPTDVCQNIPGNQSEVPQGDTVDQNGNCVEKPTPANLSSTNLQEADTNSTNVVEATTTNATTGDKYEICFTADHGKFAVDCVDTTAQDTTFKVQDTYTAPSDAGTTDTISITERDLTTGVFANPNPYTETFPIQSGNPSSGRPS